MAEPSDISLTPAPQWEVPAPLSMLAVPPPWMEATRVAGPTCGVSIAAAGEPSVTSFFGAVISEQASMTTEAMMAVAMRSLRWIIGASPELLKGCYCRKAMSRRRHSLLRDAVDRPVYFSITRSIREPACAY